MNKTLAQTRKELEKGIAKNDEQMQFDCEQCQRNKELKREGCDFHIAEDIRLNYKLEGLNLGAKLQRLEDLEEFQDNLIKDSEITFDDKSIIFDLKAFDNMTNAMGREISKLKEKIK